MSEEYKKWNFEAKQPDKAETLEESMRTVITFGKHKGKQYGEVMETQDGRAYLTWLLKELQASLLLTDPENSTARKRVVTLTNCFAVYDQWENAAESAAYHRRREQMDQHENDAIMIDKPE